MNNITILDGLQTLTNITKPFIYSTRKERIDTILEPLQGIIQLALLSKCPDNTKLSIKKNILQIQLPYFHQGVTRWYNNDKKDDLVYIFNIIKRFQLYYKKVFADRPQLYTLLMRMASKGLIQLQKTYDHGMNVTLVQTLKMYNSILLGKIDFNTIEPAVDNVKHVDYESDDDGNASFYSTRSDMNDNEQNVSTEENIRLETNSVVSYKSSQSSVSTNKAISKIQSTPGINIENIFFKITTIYPNELYEIIYNLFVLLEQDSIKYSHTITIIDNLFKKYNTIIHQWIHNHLIF